MGPPDNAGVMTVGSATRVADDIWRIVLPTPFPVGPVNAYVIDDDPFTLLDTGPVHSAARDALTAGLAALGRDVADLERVIVSHQHVDHWGLAAELAARSGAEVVALDPFADWLERYPGSIAEESTFAETLLAEHGVDPESREAGVYRGDLRYAERLLVDYRVTAGAELGFAHRTLRVLHRPGHSPSDTVFIDEERRMMFGADHVMAKPAVAILSAPLDGSRVQGRPQAMAQARDSLARTAQLDLDLVLPGHGEPVTDPAAVIERHQARYDRMVADVRDVLGGEPRSAMEIARQLRGNVAGYAAFFVLCDTLGCLDQLIAHGEAVEMAGEIPGFCRR